MQKFLETLNPFDGLGEGEINNYLYNKSTEIEPKNIKKPLIKVGSRCNFTSLFTMTRSSYVLLVKLIYLTIYTTKF